MDWCAGLSERGNRYHVDHTAAAAGAPRGCQADCGAGCTGSHCPFCTFGHTVMHYKDLKRLKWKFAWLGRSLNPNIVNLEPLYDITENFYISKTAIINE